MGVGSGYFLDHGRFPVENPRLLLCDLNPGPLAFAAERVRRYRPETLQHDVMQPFPLSERFESIGLGFLLHCLPGDMSNKARAVAHLAELLEPGGVLFGSTILGHAPHNALGGALMRLYNEKGIFGNQNDSLSGLQQALEQSLGDVQLEQCGVVALFSGRRR